MHRGKHWYVLTISLSAFLLFLIEPMAGKKLLPFFGGSTSLWATSLVFFTVALCIGYLYAYLLLLLSPDRQKYVHLATLAAAATVVLFVEPVVGVGGNPALGVLGALSSWLALPFVVLASSGPLVQRWYADRYDEPYSLYAISNLASFAGLFAYPFVLEPALSLSASLDVWRMLVLGTLCALAILTLGRSSIRQEHEKLVLLPVSLLARWAVLAALPTLLLTVVTTQITQVIAPIPLLWVVPLALYLLSLVVAFVGRGGGMSVSLLVLASVVAAYYLTPTSLEFVWAQMVTYLAVLFSGSLRIHAQLYSERPAPHALAGFYLAIAVGGAIGTLVAALLAPIVFTDYWEFPLAFAVTAAIVTLLPAIGAHERRVPFRYVWLMFIVVGLGLFIQQDRLTSVTEGIVVRSRDFYGVIAVSKTEIATALIHGRTLHGLQLADPVLSRQPTTYYTATSGVGRAFAFLRSERQEGISVGVVGLGTGTLAAYCAPNDTFAFFEIDPQIIRVADRSFSYLANCSRVSTVEGDARISLEAGLSPMDLLVIDAFNNDSVPLHLLTREALAIYAKNLKDERSLLTFHVSNRYLDLTPEIIRLAADGGFASMVVRDDGSEGEMGVPTVWVLLAKDSTVFKEGAFSGANSYPPAPAVHAWRDDYASVLSAVILPDVFELLKLYKR